MQLVQQCCDLTGTSASIVSHLSQEAPFLDDLFRVHGVHGLRADRAWTGVGVLRARSARCEPGRRHRDGRPFDAAQVPSGCAVPHGLQPLRCGPSPSDSFPHGAFVYLFVVQSRHTGVFFPPRISAVVVPQWPVPIPWDGGSVPVLHRPEGPRTAQRVGAHVQHGPAEHAGLDDGLLVLRCVRQVAVLVRGLFRQALNLLVAHQTLQSRRRFPRLLGLYLDLVHYVDDVVLCGPVL